MSLDVVKVKEAMKQKQQTLPSMFFKPIKPSRNECDVLLGESSPQVGISDEVRESDVNEDELVKCGKKETVKKKHLATEC